MEIKNIGSNILLLVAKDQYELTSTFVRLQEFYESPYLNIRGQKFTLEEFMDAYAKDHNGFTYFTDWTGFNVPGHIVNEFYNTQSLFSKKELNLWRLINSSVDITNTKYYIIGVVEGDIAAIIHEVAHALYYLNPSYNKEIRVLAEGYEKKNPNKVKKMLKQGYDMLFIIDEIQAYNVEEYKSYRKIFNKYLKECGVTI